ncbi:MAG: hemerythrin family protein [FCB group bacterium]|nr:hemerythrin family protein [FCB group bacterium]
MATARFIEWKERYSVGNNELDGHHQSVISIINDMYTAIRDQTTQQELIGILHRLLEYTQFHFEREEQLMEEHQFTDLAKHKIVHDRMVQKTKELLKQALHDEIDVSKETMSFLKDWWIDHIIVMDSRYKPYMEGKKGLEQH